MKMNLFEIAKIVNKAITNKDQYKKRIEELKSKPLEVDLGEAKVIFDIEKNRIAQIHHPEVSDRTLIEIRDAVNKIFDEADKVWMDIEKSIPL